MRQMIMAVDTAGREAALAKLLPMQRQDFEELFTIMAGLPVTIRLLDPPLLNSRIRRMNLPLSRSSGISPETARQRAMKHRIKPHAGASRMSPCVTYPEICRMRPRDEAASAIAASGKSAPVPEVMIPLAATPRELNCARP